MSAVEAAPIEAVQDPAVLVEEIRARIAAEVGAFLARTVDNLGLRGAVDRDFVFDPTLRPAPAPEPGPNLIAPSEDVVDSSMVNLSPVQVWLLTKTNARRNRADERREDRQRGNQETERVRHETRRRRSAGAAGATITPLAAAISFRAQTSLGRLA